MKKRFILILMVLLASCMAYSVDDIRPAEEATIIYNEWYTDENNNKIYVTLLQYDSRTTRIVYNQNADCISINDMSSDLSEAFYEPSVVVIVSDSDKRYSFDKETTDLIIHWFQKYNLTYKVFLKQMYTLLQDDNFEFNTTEYEGSTIGRYYITESTFSFLVDRISLYYDYLGLWERSEESLRLPVEEWEKNKEGKDNAK